MLYQVTEPNIIDRAAQHIANGELVVFPTETVYGLGANASDDQAVAKIFTAKQRPSNHPLIVHVSDIAAIKQFCNHVPDFAQQLMQQFWPGPLTLILPKIKGVANASCGGQNSIGLRCPSNPVAQQLLLSCQKLGVWGVAAPSANRFGKLSPTTGEHVELAKDILVLDAGASEFGIESCIIDCSRGQPVLLRPGVLSIAELENCIKQKISLPKSLDITTPRVSGSLASHYAPKAKLRMFSSIELAEKLSQPIAKNIKIALYWRSCYATNYKFLATAKMPDEPLAAAKQLFAQLHQFDRLQVDEIWVEAPPKDEQWNAICDRLTRATV